MMLVSKGTILNRLLKTVARCVGVLGLGIALSTAAVSAAQAKSPAKKSAAVKVAASKSSAKASTKSSNKVSAKAGKKSLIAAKPARAGKHAVAAKRGSVVRVSAKGSRAAPAAKMQRVVVKGKNGKRIVRMMPVRTVAYVPPAPPKLSYGQLAGLHGMQDALDLKSSVALVIDQDTREVLFSKNDSAILPIASLTKLMTGVIVSEARLDMNELITITQDDVDTEKGSRSRLKVGTQLTRADLMLLALMSSENRAAHALGRTYPGGLDRFVQHMNVKAAQLNMRDTRYVEPTGLSSRNQSSAQDLATLVSYSVNNPQLRELSTAPEHQFAVGERTLNYVNTNRLTRNPEWEIGLQKTGYISEAGQCLVMQAKIAGRKLIMVFLDSAGKLSRLGDAERVRKWMEANRVMGVNPVSAAGKPSQG